MMNHERFVYFLTGLFLWAALAWASPPAGSFGAISDDLMGPVGFLTRVLFYISFVCGVGFLLGSFLQYRYYRQNPQQVKLSTPITLFILALVLIGFPIVLIISKTAPWSGF